MIYSMPAYAAEKHAPRRQTRPTSSAAPRTAAIKPRKEPIKVTPPSESHTTDARLKPADSLDTAAGKPWNYVYTDTIGALAEYQVPWAKSNKTELALALVSVSVNDKATSDTLSATSSASIFKFAGEFIKPLKNTLNAGGGFAYDSGSAKVTVEGASSNNSLSSNISLTDLQLNGFTTPHITRELDAGITLKYHMDSEKGEKTTTNYSYITMTPGIGFHGNKYEGSLSFTPGVKTKGQSSGTSADNDSSAPEKETSSDLVVTGRYLLSQPLFLGGGFKSQNETNKKSTSFMMEGGMASSDFHLSAGVEIKSSTTTSALTNNTRTESKTGFMFEGVAVNAQKQPKFSAALKYETSAGKSETTTTSGSLLGLAGSGYIYF